MSNTRVRVNKADAVYLYQLLESYEGLTSYTTLPGEKQNAYRDIELSYTSDFKQDLFSVLNSMGKEFPLRILGD